MSVIAYNVAVGTKRTKPFRRIGRVFVPGETVRVECADITPEQAAFLAASDPRAELVVTPIEATPMPPAHDKHEDGKHDKKHGGGK